jgi:hypothetical protein
MADENYYESDQHKFRQHTTEQQSTQYDRPGVSEHKSSYALTLRSASGLNSSTNSSVRASLMHDMQRTHGNRAVQRSIQRPSIPVQREPTLQELEKQSKQAHGDWLDAEGDLNAFFAIPALGNVGAAGASLLNLGTAGLHAAFGDDDLASASLSNAGHRAMQAIPFLGNYLAGRDASRDWDAAEASPKAPTSRYDDLPESSQDRYQKQSLWDYITD